MSEPTTTRRTRLAGYSMLAGAVALMVPPFLGSPNGADDTAGRLRELAADPNSRIAKSIVFQLAVVLLLPGVAALVGRVRGRGTRLVVPGGVLYGAGMFGAFSFVLMEGMEASMATSGPVNDSLVKAADAAGSSAAAFPTFILAFLLFHLIGLPLLSWGLVRARTVRWWVAVLATLGTFGAFFGSGTPVEAAGWVVSGIALGLIAVTLIRPAHLVESAASIGRESLQPA